MTCEKNLESPGDDRVLTLPEGTSRFVGEQFLETCTSDGTCRNLVYTSLICNVLTDAGGNVIATVEPFTFNSPVLGMTTSRCSKEL